MEEPRTLQPLTASQMEELEAAVSSYEAALTVDAARYLVGRGLGQQEVATSRLGVVADPFPGHQHYRGMLAIPYLDREGKPLALRFRCLEQHEHRSYFHGKYNSMKDEPTRMYGIPALFGANEEIHVCEGELDSLILNKVGLPAVAIAGANNFQWRHQKMLAGFSRIYIWGDPDDAGLEFNAKLTKRMKRAKSVRLTQGDVTDTYTAGGIEAIYALIDREPPR